MRSAALILFALFAPILTTAQAVGISGAASAPDMQQSAAASEDVPSGSDSVKYPILDLFHQTPKPPDTIKSPSLGIGPWARYEELFLKSDEADSGLRPLLRLSEIYVPGRNTPGSSTGARTVMSGALSYTRGVHYPFRMAYDGGVLWQSNPLPPSSSIQTFHSLDLSQIFTFRRWAFHVSDTFAYLPQSPVFDAFGVAGLESLKAGLIGVVPLAQSSQSLLTMDRTQVDNTSTFVSRYMLSPRTSWVTSVSQSVLHFSQSNGLLNSNEMGVSTGVERALHPRDSVGVSYVLNRFAYPSLNDRFVTHSVMATYARVLNRRFTARLSAGPEMVTQDQLKAIKPRATVSADVRLLYTYGNLDGLLSYNRNLSGGSGVIEGARKDLVQLELGRRLVRSSRLSVTVAEITNVALGRNIRYNTRYVGVRFAHPLKPEIGTYWSYTLQSQSNPLPCNTAACVFEGTQHVFGVGFDWYPRGLRTRTRTARDGENE